MPTMLAPKVTVCTIKDFASPGRRSLPQEDSMARKPASNGKSSRKAAPARSEYPSPAIELASLPDEHHAICALANAEGRPHGRDLAHWQLAREELLGGRVVLPSPPDIS
jgi:hypothetical protein